MHYTIIIVACEVQIQEYLRLHGDNLLLSIVQDHENIDVVNDLQ